MSERGASRPTVLHLSPHPDDECIGSPATLMALRDDGWRVSNVACTLGSGDASRRERELRDACGRARFELRVLGSWTSDDSLLAILREVLEEETPALVVCPSPHDLHPRHESVARAAIAACEERCTRGAGPEASPRLWLWGLWADLPFPTVAYAFGEERLREVLWCLEAHRGELERNDYRRLVAGRAQMNASLGPERVFGFGSSARPPGGLGYVELLCEMVAVEGGWALGRRRWLDPSDPLGAVEAAPGGGSTTPTARAARGPDVRSLTDWAHEPSAGSRYGGGRAGHVSGTGG